MSMWKLAFKNFKESLKNYLSLMVSLAFTVLIFLNFHKLIEDCGVFLRKKYLLTKMLL